MCPLRALPARCRDFANYCFWWRFGRARVAQHMLPPGLEPGTFRLLAERSNQLSYRTRCEMTPSSFTTQNIKSSQQPLKPTPLKEETFARLARIACASHSNENTSATSARSVAASYKPPMLVTRVRLPACAWPSQPAIACKQNNPDYLLGRLSWLL